MALPGDQLPPDRDMLMRKIDDIERAIAELRAAHTAEATTIGAGGLTIKGTGGINVVDADGDQTFFAGARADVPRPDGKPQPMTIIRDDAGHARIIVWDPLPLVQGYTQEVWIFDNAGRLAFSTDIAGGIAEPWIPVPMYRQFHDSQFADATGTTETLPVSACNGNVVWEGRIGKVSHSWIQYDMLFGRVTGTSGSPTYTFHVGGTQLESFSTTSFGAQVRGPFSIADKLGQTNVVVQVKVSATGTGTDRVAMGMLGCSLRQT